MLPLHLLEKTNAPQMQRLFELFRRPSLTVSSRRGCCRLPSAIHFYLETIIFPNFMRFQEQKSGTQVGARGGRFSASGQEMGGSILFKQRRKCFVELKKRGARLGFSGTPSELMPRELGQCEYEPGSEGEALLHIHLCIRCTVRCMVSFIWSTVYSLLYYVHCTLDIRTI